MNTRFLFLRILKSQQKKNQHSADSSFRVGRDIFYNQPMFWTREKKIVLYKNVVVYARLHFQLYQYTYTYTKSRTNKKFLNFVKKKKQHSGNERRERNRSIPSIKEAKSLDSVYKKVADDEQYFCRSFISSHACTYTIIMYSIHTNNNL